MYSHEVEYTRLGLSKYPWNMCKNLNYTLCDTYPEVFVTPLSLNAPIEKYVTFRTRNRMPAVVWLDKYSGAVLVRSSQPKVGLLGKREALDEEYFNALFQLGNHDNAVHILDVRPKMNAQANAVMGGGTENLKNYQSATREFYAIENIHKVRESWRRLSKLCTSRKFAESEKAQLQKIISDSGWYYYLGTILSASGRSRDLIIQGSSVLVHCSDGWDRTAQVLSLAEMMLDPYYRTLNGFAVVIEKEWCGFGHQFSLRTGHSNNMSNYKDDQRAPIFFQFMECVYQIMVKVPEYFQFTEDLLIFILDYYLSCYSGTFLGNCELERYEELKCKERTKSLWDFVAFKEEKFINEQYDKTKQVINIPMENFEFKFWKRYFLRWQTFQDPEIDKCSLQDLTLGYYNMTSDTLSDIEIPYSTSPPDLLLPRKIRRENMIGNRILSAAPPRLRTRSASDTSISPPQKRILFAD
uniref:Myotubularin phosphatase domain-containing protein n=1 Tax=Arcella intermedia TaxID=1963864 RepID=A0A6B2L368_9EUKA